jgi:hypothetical protein
MAMILFSNNAEYSHVISIFFPWNKHKIFTGVRQAGVPADRRNELNRTSICARETVELRARVIHAQPVR